MNELMYEQCISTLEAVLPAELLAQVMKYIPKDESIKGLSQVERVWRHLQLKGEITNLQCHLLYGIRHCPSVIRDLKKKLARERSMYEIDTKPAKGCNRYGEETNWVIYFIKPKVENGQYKLF